MASTVQKNAAPSQKFIEITDIVDDIVILEGGNACLIIEIQATNFFPMHLYLTHSLFLSKL